jgi:hypothetical protein
MKKLNIFLFLVYFIPTSFLEGQSSSSSVNLKFSSIEKKQSEYKNDSYGTAYGYSSVLHYIISVPIPEGQPITLIQPWSPPNIPTAMAGDGNKSIIDDGNNYWLYLPNNGNLYNLGLITGLGEEQVNGLAIDFNNQYNFYIVTDENLYLFIYWTNPMTVELVGSFGVPGSKMIDIAIDCCSNAYTYDINSDQSYKVNLITGEATLLGPIGFDASEGQGMSFDENSGQVFLSAFNNTTQTAQLRTLDIQTGLTTLIVDWGIEHIDAFAIEGFCDYGDWCKVGDKFEYGLCKWDIENNGGNCTWEIRNMFENFYELSQTNADGFLLTADSYLCGFGTSTLSTVVMKNPIIAGNTCYGLNFDHDWNAYNAQDEAHVEVTTNNGNSWQSIASWVGVDKRNSTEFFDITNIVANTTFYIRFRTVQPGSYSWWVIDNFCLIECVPVELIGFYAITDGSDVQISWSTATETNNSGFEIERLQDSKIERLKEWKTVGFVPGFGTTTEVHHYSFIDESLQPGNYQYRLKQIDFDGTFEYSNIIEVTIDAPSIFSLEQNYPNPFNPTTKIKYSIPSVETYRDASLQVTLKVFDILGNDVATLVNEEKTAGTYEVEFSAKGGSASGGNAYKLTSGIYFYQLKAGTFVETKKMVLLK